VTVQLDVQFNRKLYNTVHAILIVFTDIELKIIDIDVRSFYESLEYDTNPF